MNLSRFVPALLLALVSGSGLWAQEFEVVSSTNLGLGSSSSAPVSLSERLDGQFTLPFDLRGGGFEFKAHAQASALPAPASIGADIDALAVTFAYQKPVPDLKALKWTLGRFALSDSTGLILNHAADGTKLAFNYEGLDLTIVTAYTGLVLRSSSSLSLTLADQAAVNSLFASPRFIASVDGSLPFPFFPAHKVTLSALAQQDLNPRSKLTKEWSTVFTGETGGTLDTQYLTFKVDGPVVDKLFYEAFGTFGSGSTLSWLEDKSSPTGFLYQYKPILSFLTGASVTYFVPQFFSSSFSARILAASGDSDTVSAVEGNGKGDSNLFVTVTPGSLGTVFNPALSNLLYYEVGGSMKPLPGFPLVVNAKLLGFQRAAAGVVNAAGVLRNGPGWMGEELDLSAAWQPFSDLSVSASVGAFLPTSGTFAAGTPEAGLQYAIKTGVTLSL